MVLDTSIAATADAADPFAAGARRLIDELHGALGHLDLTLSLARDAMAWIDRDGRIVWCNRALDRLLGADHVALLGAPLAEHLALVRDGRPVATGEHPVRRVLDSTEQIAETYELTAPDGPAKVIDLYARRDAIAGVRYGVVVIADVTDRARAQAELASLNARLAAANAELEAFSYSVSHDLRAPLRAIDGFSHALLEEYAGALDAEGLDYLHRVRHAAQNMGRLIDDLLRLSRITRGDMLWSTVDLSALCRAIANELRAAEPDREVDVAIQDGIVVSGDERLLRQALVNLLDNAWKFTRKTARARIEVDARRDGDELVCCVRDNGAGFDMSRADRLFGAFQRLHRSEDFPGLGIGLAIVRRIVHRHGGRIWAEGAVGRGATFCFTLPGGPR